MITKEQLEKWKQLDEAATDGPWRFDHGHVVHKDVSVIWIANCRSSPVPEYDAEFIAAAREAVPALISEVERLQQEKKRAAEVVCNGARENGLLTGENMQLTEEVERLRERGKGVKP